MNIAKITGNSVDYKKFESIFNKTIFEKSKPDLIRKIATYPERYTGLFRPTKPAAKLFKMNFLNKISVYNSICPQPT